MQQLYLQSLEAGGIDLRAHDVRFEEDNWESPTLGAWGIGWQVLFDGQEITQFTYFQQAGGIDLSPISVELTYGIERFAMALQDVDNVYDLEWGAGVKYREVRHRDEVEQSKYAFGQIDMPAAELHAMHRILFDQYYGLAETLLRSGLVLPALDYCLKCSHMFNLLDASGGIGVTERMAYILRVRQLAVAIAKAWAGEPETAETAVAARPEGRAGTAAANGFRRPDLQVGRAQNGVRGRRTVFVGPTFRSGDTGPCAVINGQRTSDRDRRRRAACRLAAGVEPAAGRSRDGAARRAAAAARRADRDVQHSAAADRAASRASPSARRIATR